MPIVQIQMMEGRTEDKIKALIASVTDTVSVQLEIPKERVRVLISEVPKTHWGIGGVAASDHPDRK